MMSPSPVHATSIDASLMTLSTPENSSQQIRALQYRDLDALSGLVETAQIGSQDPEASQALALWLRRWYGPLKVLGWIPSGAQDFASLWVAEQSRQLNGLIQATPINRSHSTWQIQRVIARGGASSGEQLSLAADVGSQLLRHCLENIWEARTWVSEVEVSDEATLSLYRQSGFQPLAQLTHWQVAPEQLKELASRAPKLPNLMPVSNADAPLLYQLDTVSMPPLLRQVFDRHVQDFRCGLTRTLVKGANRKLSHVDEVSAYVFEPQRKAAIGYVKVTRSRTDNTSRESATPPCHRADLTVHPAYTWLYPELLAYMATLLEGYPELPLQLVSADYQPEREQCFEQVQAERVEHRLLLSRSVWHKLRETRGVSFESLQIAEMLQGLQKRQPQPGRISLEVQSGACWDRWDYPDLSNSLRATGLQSFQDSYRPWPGSQP